MLLVISDYVVDGEGETVSVPDAGKVNNKAGLERRRNDEEEKKKESTRSEDEEGG